MPGNYIFRTPIGFLEIREENEKLTRLSLVQGGAQAAVQQQKFEHHSELLYEAFRQINEYFDGKRTCFHLPLHCEGTAFQQRVWKELQTIPYGQTRSYEQIAAGVGNPKAVRAVGGANGKNPILIIVPCHRVIHKNGDISGFACGIQVKRYLLDLEKRNQTVLIS